MGVPKKSRKGKKAWRKNIDAGDVEEFIQQQTHQERRGPALQDLKDDDLFVVDTAAAETNVPKSLRKRRARGEVRQLTSAAVLAAISAGIAPVPQPVRKAKGAALKQDNKLPPLAAAAAAAAAAGSKRKHKRKPGADLADIWDTPSTSSPAEVWGGTMPGAQLLRAGQQQQQQQQQRKKARGAPMSAAVAATGVLAGAALPVVPAVEVDAAGCSYHPEPEAHQEALAEAVAKEMTKQLQVELAPKAPALHAPEGYQKPTELEALLSAGMEVGEPEEEDEEQAAAAAAAALADDNAIDLDPADAGAPAAAAAAGEEDGQTRGIDRKTRKDRNRETRRRAQEVELAQRAALKAQRRSLDALPALAAQIDEEEAAWAAAALRKQVAAAEKALERPPRLGKHRYDPHAAPTAVLTSDEVTGSLRQLSPCFLVTKDRFMSLQKRGVIEPRKSSIAKKARKVEYVVGARREKAEAGQAELVAARKARQAAKKKQKKGSSLAAAVADW